MVRRSFPSGTRHVFQKYKKSINFHRNSHAEKCSNVNLVLFIIYCFSTVTNVNLYILYNAAKCYEGYLACLALFFSVAYLQPQAAASSNILASVHTISSVTKSRVVKACYDVRDGKKLIDTDFLERNVISL